MAFTKLSGLLGVVLLTALLLGPREVRGAAVRIVIDRSGPRLRLSCTLNQSEEEARLGGSSMNISGHLWLKDDQLLQEDHLDSPVTEYEVRSPDQSGEYQCIFLKDRVGQKASLHVKGPPKVFAKPKTERALEGGDVILVCESRSYPAIDYWDWYRQEGNVLLINGTQQRVFITESAQRSELLLRHLDTSEDSGRYVCVGTNSEGYHAAVVWLKVRSRLAALWPFLGIVLEVLVLFAIILLNEHSRSLIEEFAEE